MTFDALADSLEEDGRASIECITSSAEFQLELTFVTGAWNDDAASETFLIGFPDIEEHSCALGSIATLDEVSEHPVLWSYAEPIDDVYFSTRPIDPFHIIGAAFAAHTESVGRWRPFSDFWHATPEHLQAGHGFLFEAPAPVSDAYCARIGDAVRTQRLRRSRSGNSPKAFLFDDHFVIADAVEVRRIES